VAIAKACAQGGLRTLLLEQSDFAAGTSSRSTRIIHGGLRYLEHGEIGLVRESLRERERLRVEWPHLVRPMKFLLAFPEKPSAFSLRNPIAMRMGLWLYRRMARADDRKLPTNGDWTALAEATGAWRIFDYEDAQCEFPERLCAEWLVEAMQHGAVARNYCKVLSLRPGAHRITVQAQDLLTQTECEFEAKYVVNASGPWVDEVCATAMVGTKKLIGGVRGSHILLDRFPGAPSNPIYTEAADGRPFFIVPWNGQLMVGTTEVHDEGDPSCARASAAEIDYLLAGFNRLFPQRRATVADVHGTFSGVRPLPNTGEDATDYNAITRRSFIHDHAQDGFPRLYSIIGGKLTTAASLARQCARKLGIRAVAEPAPLVAVGPASGFDNTLQHWAHQMAQRCRISAASARATAEWHGRAALCVLRRAIDDCSLGEPILEGSDHLLAAAVQAVERESAITLADILLRRVPIALTGNWSPEQSIASAERIGRALRWSESRIAEELESFAAERERLIGVGRGSHALLPTEHAA